MISPVVSHDQPFTLFSAYLSQTLNLSLIHSYGMQWATGSIIKTPAFRELVKASPTDRIAALIMVHGSRSTTFSSQQEEEDQLTGCQSSVVHGDLLIDLP